MTRRPITAFLLSTFCCLSMTLTTFAAVTADGPASTVSSTDGRNAVIVSGKEAAQPEADPTLSGPGMKDVTAPAPGTAGEKGESLGMFTTTGYCNCQKCNSGGHALTYSGTVPKANHTISADLDLYPIGTKLMIGDIIYTVEDKGTHVEGSWIDVYYDNHDDAWGHGIKTEEVFSVK